MTMGSAASGAVAASVHKAPPVRSAGSTGRRVVQYQPWRTVTGGVRSGGLERGDGSAGKAFAGPQGRGLAAREGLFPSGSRALVMVSGGQDSLALLDILAGITGRTGGPAFLHALHVNHHLRGAESDDDEALVVRACGELGVSLTVAHRPIDKTRRQRPGEGARSPARSGPAGGRRTRVRPHRAGTHRRRPGRDHALPAGPLRGAGGLPGHASLRPALGPPSARMPARGDRRVLSRAGARVRRGPG